MIKSTQYKCSRCNEWFSDPDKCINHELSHLARKITVDEYIKEIHKFYDGHGYNFPRDEKLLRENQRPLSERLCDFDFSCNPTSPLIITLELLNYIHDNGGGDLKITIDDCWDGVIDGYTRLQKD